MHQVRLGLDVEGDERIERIGGSAVRAVRAGDGEEETEETLMAVFRTWTQHMPRHDCIR